MSRVRFAGWGCVRRRAWRGARGSARSFLFRSFGARRFARVPRLSGSCSWGVAPRELGVLPHLVSDVFYKGLVRGDDILIVGGRRLIPEWYVDVIRMALRRKGIATQAKEPAEAGPTGAAV